MTTAVSEASEQTAAVGVMNRWLVVLGAIVIQLCLGILYAWSVFTPSLKTAGWTSMQTQIVFSVALATFAITMVFAGRLVPRFGPRKLAMTGGLVLGTGFLLAGLCGGTSFTLLLLFLGVIGGGGIGIAYVIPIAVGMKWFPDKKGLITGIAVAGFGFGATLWVKLGGSWGHLIESQGLSNTLMIYGVILCVACTIGSIWMVNPPSGWKPEGWTPPQDDE